MRTLAFNIFFFLATFIYGLSCLICSLIPGRKALMGALKRYTKIMVWGMRRIGGMDIEVRGKANIPASGPVIIASKHQSYGDGFVIFSQFEDLSFVTGDHLEKFWGLKRILTKMNAVVIDSCGGSDSQAKMEKQAAAVRTEGRRLLIFPEGHLSRIGTHHRYRKGVWHLQQDFNCPVIPVANTLGQRWNQSDWAKFTGKAVVEFMEPIQPGLDKEAFMELLQDKIEGQSIALLDLENLGALNPADIGKEEENHVALAKRLAREEKAV
ncbi:1-acyl-sn-glycerol-3-phosphate acyltransferase [Litorimonas cladophorae]|uniref:1-acyl-sn-glycerol-3-phosphate acyltransferase n=1 Tax=Litorimonas cladophorae TaxID=1220491 RepID=A0A918NH82_9PROT|nr:lysophospholipid acyltransferase family protein [Litorimonas cladophorae]GGX67536.1 1-acyl-sn-glycerol-3-phosphate acyltransferase [Litorimonas cladophorae]